MSWRTFFQGSLMALGVFASAQAMALPGLVLGSFSSQDNADARRAEVEFVMREPVRVVAASVDGRQLYRVVVAAEGLSLEQLRSRALAGGLGRGWRIELPRAIARDVRKTVRRVAPQSQSLAEQKARPVPPAAPAKTAPLPAPKGDASAMKSMIALGPGWC